MCGKGVWEGVIQHSDNLHNSKRLVKQFFMLSLLVPRCGVISSKMLLGQNAFRLTSPE
jgi:hypothetical protein